MSADGQVRYIPPQMREGGGNNNSESDGNGGGNRNYRENYREGGYNRDFRNDNRWVLVAIAQLSAKKIKLNFVTISTLEPVNTVNLNHFCIFYLKE